MRRRGKGMTNLEWLARNEEYLYDWSFCECAHLAKYGKFCVLYKCGDCEFRRAWVILETLEAEHEEKN